MNNRSNTIIILYSLFLLTGSAGCKKYLDVQPEASYTESQVYGNENALDQAFNGIYLSLSNNALYGANLTMTTIDMLAQRYKSARSVDGRQDLSVYNSYDYASQVAMDQFDSLWKQGYATILATNVFLSKLDNSIQSKVLTQAHGDELKGEALALRAMVHLDLLRLFGPVYSMDSSSPAIPYYTMADGQSQPILTASQTMAKVLADLTQAAQLLAQDPVITTGIVLSPDFYAGYRNQRLNYYAVKGLLARAYLWQGNTKQAHDAADSVITQGEKWFPWTGIQAATGYNDPTTGLAVPPDRIFSSEVLFSIYNPAMYTNYASYFSPAQSDQVILAPDSNRLKTVYENNLNDYRYGPAWLIQGKSYRTFFKFADVTPTALPWRFLQPLLRKSELYYILAETDPDPTAALNYLNTARRNRGLPFLTTAVMSVELRKEYQKEFWGEGQLFFYYKRINATGVPSGAYPYPGFTVNPVYDVPLPLSETSTR